MKLTEEQIVQNLSLLGIWDRHDSSAVILTDGIPEIHVETERYNRQKEQPDNPLIYLRKNLEGIASTHSVNGNWCKGKIDTNIPHHLSHAANAFFSSNFEQSLIITIDAGGVGLNNKSENTGIFRGKGNKIECIETWDNAETIGKMWYYSTSKVFGLTVMPHGPDKAGTVMGMAGMGKADSSVVDNISIRKLKEIYNTGTSGKFNAAATLQAWTEKELIKIIKKELKPDDKYICFAGGCALNCVALGKLLDYFNFEEIYVPPTTGDAGLSLGAVQYHYHHVLDNPRINWKGNFTPYLGKQYKVKKILQALEESSMTHIKATDEDVLDLLDKQLVISVYGGKSESGKRALGNRSILADPRSNKMKDIINEKVKHREDFRPFAPSILRDEVKNWFVKDVNSPYMSLAISFKGEKKSLVPAVVHADGTARLQTVTEKDNKWYYNFIKKWQNKTGVPILLNTSFNDREPIVETPTHAINCFNKTNIDALYFRDAGILLKK